MAKRLGETGALSVSFIIVLVNTLVVLAALGTVLYTQVMFKRPPITEDAERERLQAQASNLAANDANIRTVPFQQMTINIAGNENGPQGKLHYATIAFSLEVRSEEAESEIESVKQQFLDKLIQAMSKKTFEEISNVHGRFLLRSEMMDMANSLLKEPRVTNVFFTYFVVQ